MCRGVARGTNLRPGEMFVTYLGPNMATANRNIACKGFHCPTTIVPGWECDEFSFASTAEGGAAAAAMCVWGKHNNVIGTRWGTFLNKRKTSIKAGSKVRVKIINFDCAKVSATPKRHVKRASAILRNETGIIYLNGSSFRNDRDGPVAVLQPLDISEDFVGDFVLRTSIAQGEFISGTVLGDDGTEYGS